MRRLHKIQRIFDRIMWSAKISQLHNIYMQLSHIFSFLLISWNSFAHIIVSSAVVVRNDTSEYFIIFTIWFKTLLQRNTVLIYPRCLVCYEGNSLFSEKSIFGIILNHKFWSPEHSSSNAWQVSLAPRGLIGRLRKKAVLYR